MENSYKPNPTDHEEQERIRFGRFLRRLRVSHRVPKLPIRNWLAWLGVALFIALVILYYATGGAG